jgi:hypothetical protein
MSAHDWVYISKRIVDEVVRANRAGMSGTITTQIGITGANVSYTSGLPEYDNVFELAERATDILAPRVKALDDRSIRSGDIVRAMIHLHPAKLPVWKKWSDNTAIAAAAFASIERFSWGRVYVGLVGSMHNFKLDTSTIWTTGRTPSDAVGLYELLASVLPDELDAADPYFQALAGEDRAERISGSPARFEIAANAFEGADFQAPRELREVLMLVHDAGRDVDLNLYDRGRHSGAWGSVLIGTPIWIKAVRDDASQVNARGYRNYEIEPKDNKLDPRAIQIEDGFGLSAIDVAVWERPPAAAASSTWAEYDLLSELLASRGGYSLDLAMQRWSMIAPPRPALVGSEVAEDLLHSRNEDGTSLAEVRPDRMLDEAIVRALSSLVDDSVWQDFLRWFADQAGRFGPVPVELKTHPRRAMFRWKYQKDEYEPSGRYGWLVHAAEDGRFGGFALVTADGEAISCNSYAWVEGDGEATEIDKDSRLLYGANMFISATDWRIRPFGRG